MGRSIEICIELFEGKLEHVGTTIYFLMTSEKAVAIFNLQSAIQIPSIERNQICKQSVWRQ